MSKKRIELELVHDIHELVHLQELTVMELRKQKLPQRVKNMQEDILRVLKVVQQFEIINIDAN